MGIGQVAAATVATVGGGYMVFTGAKNWYNGKDIGKIQVALGVVALAGGLYSLNSQMQMNLQQVAQICDEYDPSTKIACDALRKEVKESCAAVLKKGYENIPGLDLEKHVQTVGPNFSSGVEHPRCDTELTREGRFFLYQSGLKASRKYIYEAVTEAGLKIHGVIRHDHSIDQNLLDDYLKNG